MKKRLLTLVIFLFAIANLAIAQDLSPEMEAFMERIDGTSLEDIEAELDEGIKGLRAFSEMFSEPASDGIVDYSGEQEENFGEPFKIDTSVVTKALLQFDDMGFQQSFGKGKSLVKFNKINDKFWNTVWMEEGMTEQFTPKTIYFKGGTTKTKDISTYRTSFFFEEQWGDMAVIDSIAIDYQILYTAKYDSLLLTKKSKKVKFKNGIIKVKKLEKNYLYLTISDEYADGLYVNALNAEGKVLNSNSSSYAPTADSKADDGMSEILKLLEEVQIKLKKKEFENSTAFKKYIVKRASKIKGAKDTDGVYHKKYYFEGNIETVKLYIETEGKTKRVSFTAKNNSNFGEVIFVQDKTHNIFLDADAKELFRTAYSPITSIGSRYFQNDSVFYHLNLKTKKLDELDVFRVWEAENGLAFIQNTKEASFLTYNADNELLSDIPFDDLYSINNEYLEGISNKVSYILNAEGAIKKLDGISEIRELFDGRMKAKSNNKYGYLEASGETVIPFIYAEANNFIDGYAIVADDNNRYGLIDTSGKPVIPLIYSNIHSFENGIAWATSDDEHQLIDTTGEVLVRAKLGSYSILGSGLNKTYTFGNISYDAFGKVMPQEK